MWYNIKYSVYRYTLNVNIDVFNTPPIKKKVDTIVDNTNYKLIFDELLEKLGQSMFCGDIWCGIDCLNHIHKNGLFVQVELKELLDGEYSENTFVVYAYKVEDFKEDGYDVVDYSETVYMFEFEIDA